MKKFTADFETATWLEDRTFVWAWATCTIDNEYKVEYGNNIDSFMRWCEDHKNSKVYFHNEKFDGEFIIYWLLKHGYKHVEKEEIGERTFTTLINSLGQFYSITVYYKVYTKTQSKITFIDSLKIIPFSVDEVAKCFGLPINKLKINYDEVREENTHIMTNEEKEYIQNDVKIMAMSLNTLFKQGLDKMTQGSNALSSYKKLMKKNYDRYFPALNIEEDKQIRQSYRGGFTYVSPEWAEKNVGKRNRY